jgi:ribose transport system permease protein
MSDSTLKAGLVDSSRRLKITAPSDRWTRLRIGEYGWIWLATIFLFAASLLVAPGTMRSSSLLAMLPFAGILSIVAVGQTLIIQQRGLDLSAPGMMTLSGLIVAKVGFATGSPQVGVFVALAASLVIGAANGILVARVAITPLVATLATNALLIGAVRAISGGVPMMVPPSLESFSHERLFGLPYSLLLGIAFVAFVTLAVGRTVVGRRFVAVGANPRTALAAGTVILRYQVGTYAVAASCFAVAGVLYAGFIGSASNTAGNDYLLPGIATVVVGGTPFTGGRGSVVASGVAALFMTQLTQMVLALGAGPSTQLLVQATAIVAATSLRQISARAFVTAQRLRDRSKGVGRRGL